ncbi:SpoIID/LytB domain-containing protein [Clostridium aminobutyricum]|uniref:SpoIID/LytB domain-containing protein n=1 Tax=Clostridium aminobutyricum TaxID=33953 RepID=A0A939IG60_CLOAM|nr:SpoIID/LytB domain-containing protein [Clostridium aminobutyricum]MBN7772660.1 SpoIID/LytB domain-containing protein [Clostridium aminobutyricum]
MKYTVKYIMSTLAILFVFVFVFSAANIPFALAASSDEPNYIRIGLKYGSSSADTYNVTFKDGVILGYGDNNGFNQQAVFDDIVLVSVNLSGSQISLIGTKNSGESIDLMAGLSGVNCIMPTDYDDDGTFAFLGSQYRGGMAFNITSGKLTMINLLPVEEYLYGVINGELSCSYPIEALKAQAVAARSFAIEKLGTHNSYGFDLCDTTHCQVYKGYNDEHDQTTEAVDKTRGETIKYEGKTVPAFFYKNSGGYTQDSADVWTGDAGYLKAVKDEYSPVYSWSQTYTVDELASKLTSAGYAVGTIQSVEITKRNQSGAVDTLQFTGTSGTVQLQKEKIRTVFGASIIKSNMFSFSEYQAGASTSKEDFEGYICPQNSANMISLSKKAYVLGKDGKITLVDTDKLYIHNGSSTTRVSELDSSEPSGSGMTKGLESVSSDSITFYGLGYGHGVGLPQDSAVEMAKRGFTYDEILKYYYTDITIE